MQDAESCFFKLFGRAIRIVKRCGALCQFTPTLKPKDKCRMIANQRSQFG